MAFKDIVWHGEMYRLANPHEGDISSVMYVSEDKRKAVMFTYLANNRVDNYTINPLVLKGLDANKKYSITETNLYPGSKTTLPEGKTYSGDYLMKAGFNPDVNGRRTSVVLEIAESK